MSTLIVDPLFDGITFSQKIKVSRNVSVAHIRPWVYIQGVLVDGQFQCKVLQGATELTTSIIDFSDINAAITEDYAHGFIRFDFDSLILHRAEGETDTEYTFEFSMINHTTDPVNYLGIARQWDAATGIVYGDVDGFGEPVNDQVSPCGYDIYEYRS